MNLKTSKPHYFAAAAVTIDGYIARYPGHSSSWTSKEDKEELHRLEDKADVIVMASKSYEFSKNALAKRNCIVLTTKIDGVEEEGKLKTLFNPTKKNLEGFISSKGYKEVCILGGRVAYDYFLQKGLIDDLYITIEPVLFGSGIGMFSKEVSQASFGLVKSKKLNKQGSLLLHYRKA